MNRIIVKKDLMEIEKFVLQLKADLGIIPHSDLEQPEKFANMNMKEAEQNIDDFKEVLLDYLKVEQSETGGKNE